MAVVPGGFYGEYFVAYQRFTDSRQWNTTNYDYPIVKNKGQFDAEAKNEETGKALFVSVNKNGYFNAQGVFVEDTLNPIYQIRDSYGQVDNNYYVNQETGDVYYRPESDGNYIRVPATARVNGSDTVDGTYPQYLGTTFKLDSVPNPESFGQGQANNLNILNNYGTAAERFDYYEVEVNGVKVFAGGPGANLNTASGTAVVTNKDNALFWAANSFTGGANDFTSISGNWAYNPGSATTPADGFYANYGGGNGNSLNLTGAANSYVEVPDSGTLDINGSYVTMEAWVNPTAVATEMQIVNKENSYELAIRNGKLQMAVEGTGASGWFWTNNTAPDVPLNQWSHVAGVYDATTNEMRLYVNGVLQHTQANGDGGNVVPSALPLSIGRRPGGSYFTGQIDEVRISDNARYSGGSFTVPSTTFTDDGNTRGLWHFDEAAGSGNVADGSGNGNTGTVNAGASITESNPSPIGGNNTTGEAHAYFNTRTADNFVLKTDIRIPTPTSDPAGGWAGIQFRASAPKSHYTESGYMVRFMDDGSVELLKAGAMDTGNGAGVIAVGNTTPIGTTYRNVEIHANGSNIRVLVDGTQVINYTDDVPYRDGYVSYRTNNHMVDFDNFELTGYQKEIHLLYNALKKGDNSLVIKGYGNTNSYISSSNTSVIGGVNLSTSDTGDTGSDNSVPDLAALSNVDPNDSINAEDINNEIYRHSTLLGTQDGELLSNRGYWSASTQSSLGIMGKIDFKNREGGSLHKVRDGLINLNSIMQNLNSLLGADLDLFNTHINVIR